MSDPEPKTTPHDPEISSDLEATIDSPVAPAGFAGTDLGSIGPYRLVRKLGEGGMGQVWLAEQSAPVKRQVALKIIKAGRYDDSALLRFDLERQALAIMDHPAIAKVFDAGSTPQGQPYFVMEYVPGFPITDYCDRKRLPARERLALFIKVCEGVQHAHQKAIMHRDLKPSNILVVEVDGKPMPRIIDFGIAKAISQQSEDETLMTRAGGMVGTPGYMSPEQADPSVPDVDTRTDVYSLGVVLYELLTGVLPFDVKQWKTKPLHEVLRQLHEEDPSRPSTRISGGPTSTGVAENRNTDPRQLASLLRGDLDWITLKALEKDRARRYGTPLELAADIRRYLQNEPVTARPASAAYRAKKYAQRHKALVAATAVVFVVLVAGVIVSAWQAQRARASASEAQAVLQFMQDRILAAARPEGQEGGLGREVSIHKAVDAAAPLIADSFKGQPRVEASIRSALGMTYDYLGKPQEAIQQLSRAVELRTASLGPGAPETIDSRNKLSEAYFDAGRNDDAIALLEPTLKLAERKLGNDATQTIDCRNDLAMDYSSVGRSSEAIALHEANLRVTEAKFGPDDPYTLTTRNNLALAYWNADRIKDAVALDEDTLKRRAKKLGPDHPLTLTSRNNLALEYNAVGRNDEAIAMLETNLKLRQAKLGPNHPDTLASGNSLAAVYWIAGRVPEATAMLESTLQGLEATVGPDHPTTLVTKSLLAETYGASGQDAKAEAMLRDVLTRSRKQFGANDPRTAPALAQLGGWLVNHDKSAEAEPMLRQCLAIREKLEPDVWTTFNTRSQLGGSLLGLGRYAEAEPLILEGYQGLKAREENISPQGKRRVPEAANRIVKLYEAWGKPEKAAEWRAKLAGASDASKHTP